MNGANNTGAKAKPSDPPERCARHRQTLAVIGQPINQRRRRRMECGAAEPADHEDHPERKRRGGPADEAETRPRRGAVPPSRAAAAASDPRARQTAAVTPSSPSGSTSPRCRRRRTTGRAPASAVATTAHRCCCRHRRRRAWTRPSRSTGAGRASRVRGGSCSTGHPLEASDDQVARFAELRNPQQLCGRRQRGERQHDGDEQA